MKDATQYLKVNLFKSFFGITFAKTRVRCYPSAFCLRSTRQLSPPNVGTSKPSWRARLFSGKESRSSIVDTDSEVDSVTKEKSDVALQEEQDALAQAEIWMAIAAQSRQEGSNGE